MEKNIPALWQKSMLDVMIYTFIDAQRSIIPGISVENSALAFIKHYQIDEQDLSISKITKTFFRIQKELHDERKTKV